MISLNNAQLLDEQQIKVRMIVLMVIGVYQKSHMSSTHEFIVKSSGRAKGNRRPDRQRVVQVCIRTNRVAYVKVV